MNRDEEVLAIKNLNIYYNTDESRRQWIIKNINFSLKNGEVALIIGRSGSGKTTLARAIMGLLDKLYNVEIKGEIYLLGRKPSLNSVPQEIKYVGQNPYVYFTEHSVKRDLVTYASKIYGEHAEKIVLDKAIFLEVEDLLERFFFELSGGEARRLAILKAVLSEPKILVLDEPLMWVDDKNTHRIIELINKLRETSTSIVVFEHRFIPLLDTADSVYLLINGSLHKVSKEEIINKLSRISTKNKECNEEIRNDNISKDTMMFMKNVVFSYDSNRIFESLDLEISKGDLITIIGDNGSGKTSLLRLIAGQLKPRDGKIKWLVKPRIGYLPQRPISFFSELTVQDEVVEMCRQSREQRECIEKIKKKLKEYRVDYLDKSPFNLSWGEQIKTALILLSYSDVYNLLLLDEPFTGLDYSERCRIGLFLTDIMHDKHERLAILLVASTLDSLACIVPTKSYRIVHKRLEREKTSSSLLTNYVLYETINAIYDGEMIAKKSS